LRKAFRSRSRYMHMYNRADLIAHEMAHIGRMAFEEPRFEELLAYRTAPSRFHRWFGPIVQSSKESLLFIISLTLIITIDFLLLANGAAHIFYATFWLKLIPIGLIAYGLVRLWRKHQQFDACLKRLTAIVNDSEISNAIIYRLTDQEIQSFAIMTPEEILSDAKERKMHSLRWTMIYEAYFSKRNQEKD
jgi:hypothetical protein